MSEIKLIVCLDFDGVIHSYSSGWKGPRSITDEPVPGSLEFIVGLLDTFSVAILSSRSHAFFGRAAMKRWLIKQLCNIAPSYEETPAWWLRRISQTAFADPWATEVEYAASLVVRQIQWPKHKPPAILTIDDRAMTFTGEWPSISDIKGFKPWNKK